MGRDRRTARIATATAATIATTIPTITDVERLPVPEDVPEVTVTVTVVEWEMEPLVPVTFKV